MSLNTPLSMRASSAKTNGATSSHRRPGPRSSAGTTLSPRRLFTQILALQTLYTVSLTLLTLFTALVFGKPFTFSLLLDWRSIRSDTAMGWYLGVVIYLICGSLAGTLGLLWVVGRSKLVADFVCTLHSLQFLLVWAWTRSSLLKEARAHGEGALRDLGWGWLRAWPGFGEAGLWWLVWLGSCAIMGMGGLWACRWRELRPINIGGPAKVVGGGRDIEMASQGESSSSVLPSDNVADGDGAGGRRKTFRWFSFSGASSPGAGTPGKGATLAGGGAIGSVPAA